MTVPPFPGVPGERGLSWLRLGDVISSNVFSLSRNLASREQDLGKGRAEVLVQPAALGMGFREAAFAQKTDASGLSHLQGPGTQCLT